MGINIECESVNCRRGGREIKFNIANGRNRITDQKVCALRNYINIIMATNLYPDCGQSAIVGFILIPFHERTLQKKFNQLQDYQSVKEQSKELMAEQRCR